MSLIPVLGHGICSLVNGETLLDLRGELRSDAFLAPLTFLGFESMTRWRKSCILITKPLPLLGWEYQSAISNTYGICFLQYRI